MTLRGAKKTIMLARVLLILDVVMTVAALYIAMQDYGLRAAALVLSAVFFGAGLDITANVLRKARYIKAMYEPHDNMGKAFHAGLQDGLNTSNDKEA